MNKIESKYKLCRPSGIKFNLQECMDYWMDKTISGKIETKEDEDWIKQHLINTINNCYVDIIKKKEVKVWW